MAGSGQWAYPAARSLANYHDARAHPCQRDLLGLYTWLTRIVTCGWHLAATTAFTAGSPDQGSSPGPVCNPHHAVLLRVPWPPCKSRRFGKISRGLTHATYPWRPTRCSVFFGMASLVCSKPLVGAMRARQAGRRSVPAVPHRIAAAAPRRFGPKVKLWTPWNRRAHVLRWQAPTTLGASGHAT